jgi:hypothetical protein
MPQGGSMNYLDNADMLRVMAANSGWIERGGLAIREPSRFQTGGEVVGRTGWVGQPEWARGFGMNQPEIIATVEKALSGKRLGKLQALLLDEMMIEVRATKETGRAEAQPASPAAPCRVPQHFPEPDRQRGACKLYTMSKRQPTGKPRGRPPIPGRMVLVKLEERDIERARELGGGGKHAMSAGVRKAIRQATG